MVLIPHLKQGRNPSLILQIQWEGSGDWDRLERDLSMASYKRRKRPHSSPQSHVTQLIYAYLAPSFDWGKQIAHHTHAQPRARVQ